jgi:uncharacterized protein DUF4262
MESFSWFDELCANIHGHIERIGWSLMSVMGDAKHLPWCYTIGLIEKFDHPELIMIGLEDRSTAVPLNGLGMAIAEGHTFARGEVADVATVPVLFGEVHEAHWESGMFAKWHHYYQAVGYPALPPMAFQVLWPDDNGFFPGEQHWDRGHDPCQPLLSSPTPPPAPRGCITFRDTLRE